MKDRKFSFVIANDTIREKVFIEVWCDNNLWVEISQETEDLVVTFFSPPNSKYWELPFDKAMQALEAARRKLLELD